MDSKITTIKQFKLKYIQIFLEDREKAHNIQIKSSKFPSRASYASIYVDNSSALYLVYKDYSVTFKM